MLYTLSLYTAACPLYLNKTGGKNYMKHCGSDYRSESQTSKSTWLEI